MGWGFAQAKPGTSLSTSTPTQISRTLTSAVDPVTPEHQLGQDLYLENCATCHVGVPPAIFPRDTWLQLIQDPQHYGTEIRPLVDPTRLLVWNYLEFYSRARGSNEDIPYRVNNSRYFRILHPDVELPRPTRLSSCQTCHPGAEQFNYRSLSSEWQEAP
jgi:hypothetical protein